MYRIHLEYRGRSTTDLFLVRPDEVVSKNYNAARTLYFVLKPSFSTAWIRGNRSYGPALDLGFSHKYHYYGVNFNWSLLSDDEYSEFLGGAAFQYYRGFVFDYSSVIISVSPGLSIGFWNAWGEKHHKENPHERYDYYSSTGYYSTYDEFLFAGLSVKAKLGYDRMFGTFTYSVYLGTKAVHTLQYGFQINL
ncbi:hypothetical protein QA601_07785 [Chitinispirillales bacterium ANBcel5]|uniref:hypothetical protein n=1 Tax=Cellulosispirillum alkaliphilum TaxID=3039283 RepID=UPI002A58238D|nr:hypothetical protein [Chitinispirillales bacterium ANBcel5]